jgi:transketolase C-terminal domain/subunit
VYYSLSKDDRTTVPGLQDRFDPGRLQILRRGRAAAILSMGSVSVEAAAAADELARRGIQTTLAIVSNFSPDPEADLAEVLSSCPHAVSVEAQTVSGGLGAFAASVIATHGLRCRLRVIGVRRPPDGTIGSRSDRWRLHGLDRDSIVANVLEAVRSVQS